MISYYTVTMASLTHTHTSTAHIRPVLLTPKQNNLLPAIVHPNPHSVLFRASRWITLMVIFHAFKTDNYNSISFHLFKTDNCNGIAFHALKTLMVFLVNHSKRYPCHPDSLTYKSKYLILNI